MARKKYKLPNRNNESKLANVSKRNNAKKKAKPKKKRQPVKRKLYSVLEMQKAVNAVNTRGMSLRKAANFYNVPPTSLYRAANTKKNSGEDKCSKPGPLPVLSTEIEDEIVKWILYRAETGWPVTKFELLDSIQSYIKSLGIEAAELPFTDGKPGRHWYENFRARYPQITIRTAQQLTSSRASVTEEQLRDWFCEIDTFLTSKNLKNIPSSRIFNCDETAIRFNPKPDKILTAKGAKSTFQIVHGSEKECITGLFMYSADGTRGPPMLMFKYADGVPPEIYEKLPRYWGIGNSDSGWMTAESFYEYITNVFYPWLVAQGIEFPIVLYLDNHSSHITIPLVSFCREKQIELIGLYPNSTHIIQPLDISFFHPFKDVWKRTLMKYKSANKISKLKNEDLANALLLALDSFKNEKTTIEDGFRAAGLVPFNPDAVEFEVLQKKKKSTKKIELSQPDNQNIEDTKLHLATLEKNLSNELLNNFKEAEVTGIWSKDIINLGFFQYWLSIKRACDGSTDDAHPLIKSDVRLTNHEVIFRSTPASSPNVNDNRAVNEDIIDDENSTPNLDTSMNVILESNGMNIPNAGITIEIDDSISSNELSQFRISNNVEFNFNDGEHTFIIDEDLLYDDDATPIDLDLMVVQEEMPDSIVVIDISDKKQNSVEFIDNDMLKGNNPLRDISNSTDAITMSDRNQNLSQIIDDDSLQEINDSLYSKVNSESSPSEKKYTFSEANECSSVLKENVIKSDKQMEVNLNDSGVSRSDILDENMQERIRNIKKESNQPETDKEKSHNTTRDSNMSPKTKRIFTEAFTLPHEYLPKSKKAKIAATGKPKPPSVGTSDQWMEIHMEKERVKKLKQEEQAKKKMLREEKKKIAEEKKKLAEEKKAFNRDMKQKIKELDKQIKRPSNT